MKTKHLVQILILGILAVAACDQIGKKEPGAGNADAAEEAAAPSDTFVLPDAEPDWAPVKAYIDVDTAWHEKDREIRGSDDLKEEKQRRLDEELGEHPDVVPAMAAATAIVKAEGGHEKARDAAEFLMYHPAGVPGQIDAMTLGANTMLERFPEYDRWPEHIAHMAGFHPVGKSEAMDALFQSLPGRLTGPVDIVAAKYYLGLRYMALANGLTTAAADRPVYRNRGIELVSNMADGIEDVEIVTGPPRFKKNGDPRPYPTAGKLASNLLKRLETLTAGAALPEVSGTTLDGVTESLSDYRGRAVLLDFWATWCGPCIKSMPKLEALDAKYDEKDFVILSVSVDEELDTVLDFQANQPMPWANWHVGPKSEPLKVLSVNSYPTYILVDPNGIVMTRQNDFNEDLETLIDSTMQ